MTTPAIIDIVILIALAVFAVLGAKKGLLQSLAGLLIVAVALVGATIAAQTLTEPAVALCSPVVERHLEKKMDQALEAQAHPEEPSSAEELLALMGVDGKLLDTLAGRARDEVREQGVTMAMAVVESLAYSVIHALLFALAFILLLAVLLLAVRAMDLMLRLPVLRTLNRTGGALVGLAQGLVLTALVLWLARRMGYPVDRLAETSKLIPYLASRMTLPR